MIEPVSIPEDLSPWRLKLPWASRVLLMPLVGFLIIGSVCADSGSPTFEYPELDALLRLDLVAAMKVFLTRHLTSEFKLVLADMEEKSVIIGEETGPIHAPLEERSMMGTGESPYTTGQSHARFGSAAKRRIRPHPDSSTMDHRVVHHEQEHEAKSHPLLQKMAAVSGWLLNRYQTLALLIFSSVLAIDLWFWELFFGPVMSWGFSNDNRSCSLP